MTINNIYYLFIIMISTYAVILTGERTSALLTVSSCLLAFFIYKPSFKLLVSSLISLMIIISFIFYTDETLFTRFSSQLIDNIPLLNTNTSYWGTWRSGLQQGLENFWFGVVLLAAGILADFDPIGYLAKTIAETTHITSIFKCLQKLVLLDYCFVV